MTYQIHTLQQGSAEWHDHRRACYNASELALAAGVSMHGNTRTDLIRKLATGIESEVSPFLQKIFDDGHRFELLARPLAEEIIGRDLYPITASMAVDGLRRPLGASLDGATDDDTINFEHKTLNADLASALSRGTIPAEYHWQMEQGMLVNGAMRTLFMATKWDDNNQLVDSEHCWYKSNPDLRAKIIQTWQQVEQDVDNYQHVEKAAPAIASPVSSLPVLFVKARGEVTETNMPEFKALITGRLSALNLKPTTDQEFADSKELAKNLRDGAKRALAVREDMLAQTVSIGQVARDIDDLAKAMNASALALEKAVTAEEEARKYRIIDAGRKAFAEHIATLNNRLNGIPMPAVHADFAGSIKGKRNVESMEAAVNAELARAQVESSRVADRIELNARALRELAGDYMALFPDMNQIVLKAADDLMAVAKARIGAQKEAEQQRADAERKAIDAARAANEQTASVVPQIASSESAAVEAAPTEQREPADDGATIKLGEINERLGFTVSADFLAKLGFVARHERNAKLYRMADFKRICFAISDHACDIAKVGASRLTH